MKLSLTLLVIFGLVAFIGAAPAEEKPETPEELKPEDDLPDEEQAEAPEVEDEGIPEDELSELVSSKDAPLEGQDMQDEVSEDAPLEEQDMQDEVSEDPRRKKSPYKKCTAAAKKVWRRCRRVSGRQRKRICLYVAKYLWKRCIRLSLRVWHKKCYKGFRITHRLKRYACRRCCYSSCVPYRGKGLPCSLTGGCKTHCRRY